MSNTDAGTPGGGPQQAAAESVALGALVDQAGVSHSPSNGNSTRGPGPMLRELLVQDQRPTAEVNERSQRIPVPAPGHQLPSLRPGITILQQSNGTDKNTQQGSTAAPKYYRIAQSQQLPFAPPILLQVFPPSSGNQQGPQNSRTMNSQSTPQTPLHTMSQLVNNGKAGTQAPHPQPGVPSGGPPTDPRQQFQPISRQYQPRSNSAQFMEPQQGVDPRNPINNIPYQGPPFRNSCGPRRVSTEVPTPVRPAFPTLRSTGTTPAAPINLSVNLQTREMESLLRYTILSFENIDRSLQQSYTLQKHVVPTLQSSVSRYERRNAELTTLVERLRQQKGCLEARIDALSSSLMDSQTKEEAARANYESRESEVVGLKQALQLAQIHLREKMEELNENAQVHEQLVLSKDNVIEELKNEKELMEKKRKFVKNLLRKANLSVESLEQANASLTEEMQKLQEDKAKKQQELENMEKAHQEEINKLLEKNAKLQEENEKLKMDLKLFEDDQRQGEIKKSLGGDVNADAAEKARKRKLIGFPLESHTGNTNQVKRFFKTAPESTFREREVKPRIVTKRDSNEENRNGETVVEVEILDDEQEGQVHKQAPQRIVVLPHIKFYQTPLESESGNSSAEDGLYDSAEEGSQISN